MSEALIASLNGRITELTNQVGNLKAALKEERTGRRTAAEKLAEAEKAMATLTTERDTAMQAAKAAPDDLRNKIADLEGKLAHRDLADTFRAKALELGANPQRVGDLFSLANLKAGEATEDHIAEYLATAKEARSWAFDGGDSQPQGDGAPGGHAAGSQSIRLSPVTVPAGGGRGAPDHSSSKFRVTADQLGDGTWMHANHEAVARASAEGRLEIV